LTKKKNQATILTIKSETRFDLTTNLNLERPDRVKNPIVNIYINEDCEYISTIAGEKLPSRLNGESVLTQTITEYPVVKLPWRFISDHEERECPSPVIVRSTKSHCFVAAIDCDGWRDLVNDAEFYIDPYGPDAEYLTGIKKSARATLKALREVSPVEIKRTYKIEMFADHIPAWGWFPISENHIDLTFKSKKDARDYIKNQKLEEAEGFKFRVVPC
jgi:hypothetical protein